MRLTQNLGKIDMEKAEKEIMEAYNSGVNYFDTAYIYPGSEEALGKILEKNQIRDKVNIATKLPLIIIKKAESIEKYFSEQLKRLRTDHIDYYLMHMLPDINTWDKFKSWGIIEWLQEKKESGAIKQVGFSYHGNSEMFCKLIDAYDWDFCQIQYNYLDENSQAGKKGIKYAASKNIPVVIMEPLRGGKLVKGLPKEAKEAFEKFNIKRSPAEWSFRWLWNQPEVTCVLSGMNSIEMVRENIKVASEVEIGEITEEQEELFRKVVKAINGKMKVGCTGCRYCMPCPKNVDIPGTFASYNRRYSDGKIMAMIEYFMCTALRKDSSAASNCVECGKCETHCPQHIEIRKELKNARKSLEGPLYKIGRKVVKVLKIY